MLQDIYPHQFDNLYIPQQKIEENSYILHFNGNSFLLKSKGDSFEIPRTKDLPGITENSKSTFLFSFNDTPCFLIWDKPETEEPIFIYKELIFFRKTLQLELAWIGHVGFHLMNWYVQNKFCGKCGSATQHKSDERAVYCPNCNMVIYPKISPAIIVAIISGDKILLARNSSFVGGWYSLVAGYVDIGETLEETLRREVKEEVEIDITNIRYYKSQPWPLSGSMMIGFVAEADENQPICIDNNEIAEAAWFTRGNLPDYSLNLSIAGEMIEKFEKSEL